MSKDLDAFKERLTDYLKSRREHKMKLLKKSEVDDEKFRLEIQIKEIDDLKRSLKSL